MEDNGVPSNRERAVQLRQQGLSYREIREVIPVPESTLSDWLRGVDLTEHQRDRMAMLQHLGRTKAARTIQARRLAREEATRATARAEVSPLQGDALFIAGVVAYWAEGAKAKPWQRSAPVSFINSDDHMIVLFLRWLQFVGVRVCKSVELNRRIAGWWEGLSVGLGSLDASARSGVV